MTARALVTAIVLLALSPALAQDEATDDGLVMLPCEGKCAAVTRNPIRKTGSLDSGWRGERDGEGYFELQFTIMPDGTVANDITVLRQFGPSQYVEEAKRAIRGFTYEPAIVEGKAVSVPHRLRILNTTLGIRRAAQSSIVHTYREAGDLLKSGKLDEARAELKEAILSPRLNFYERGLMAYLLTLTDMQRKDYVEARIDSYLALFFPTDSLPRDTFQSLAHNYVVASLYIGDVVGAAKILENAKRRRILAQADPLILEIDQVRKKLDGLPSYGIDVRIPDRDLADVFEIYLYRRHFGFSNVKGKIDSVTIYCREQETTSPYAEKIAWSVPSNWSDCSLMVKGTPGTTFQLDQYVAAPSAH